MADSSFVSHAVELLEPLGPVRARAMMGGHVLFCGTLPVALIADDRLYLKVDAVTKAAFAEAGGEPFTYEMRGRAVEMSYWSAPDGALDDAESMLPWARLALEAAARARSRSRSRSKSRSRSGVSAPSPRAAGRGSGRGARSRLQGSRPGQAR